VSDIPSDLFSDIASIDYPILDADAHVNEPPNLWQDSVPGKWKDRAPKLVHTEKGDIWHFDGGRETWPVGLTATAGQSYFQFAPMGQTYESMRPGSFETGARLRDMDADGIYAQVLYPSVTLKGARVYSGERELQLACVRAYNEWIRGFCEGSGGRLVAQAIIPTTGVEDALAELDFAMKNGHRGAVISSFPNGSLYPKDVDDAFWAKTEEAGFPVAVHIGSFLRTPPPAASRDRDVAWAPSLAFIARAVWVKAGGQTLDVACDLLFSGIFQRYPRLKMLMVEDGGPLRDVRDAEPDLPPQLLRHLHGRPLRHRAAPSAQRGPPPLVHRLPAQWKRLARLGRRHRAHVPRRPEGRSQEDAPRQLQGPVPARRARPHRVGTGRHRVRTPRRRHTPRPRRNGAP
jgi:predicted TIM-barrel fold metal-dependent hydrolase